MNFIGQSRSGESEDEDVSVWNELILIQQMEYVITGHVACMCRRKLFLKYFG
jgi:hypothetical protein